MVGRITIVGDCPAAAAEGGFVFESLQGRRPLYQTYKNRSVGSMKSLERLVSVWDLVASGVVDDADAKLHAI